MLDLPAGARLVAWGNAVLRGDVALDEAVDAVVDGDPPHRVAGLPGEDSPVGLSLALGRLRALGVRELRLVLPRPGDPAGLPGPPEVNVLAVDAGQVVVAVGGPDLVLVPDGRARWRVHGVRPTPPPATTLSEASRELQAAIRDATEELTRLDVARALPADAAAGNALAELAARPDRPQVPASHPHQAVGVLTLAQRMLAVVALAEKTEGAAVSAGEMVLRTAALRDLGTAARRALEAACNALP